MAAITRRGILTVSGLAGAGLFAQACWPRRSGTIAIIPKTTAIDYWDNLRAGAQAAAARFQFRILWNAPQSETNFAQQALMLEDVIRQKVDAIVLAPSHGSVLASGVRHASAERIPLVVVDSPVMVDPGAYVAYIGSDAARMGTLAAVRTGTVLGGEGEIAILGVSPTVEAAVQRERAFASVIASKFPKLRIVDARYGLADHARSREIAGDIIAERPHLAALFASDTFAVRGAFSALRVLKSRKVRLIGVAQELDLLSYLERGLIDSLVVQDPYSMGRSAMEILADVLHDRYRGPRRIETRVAIARSDNLHDPGIQELVSRRQII